MLCIDADMKSRPGVLSADYRRGSIRNKVMNVKGRKSPWLEFER